MVAYDCPDANPHDLMEEYQIKSEDVINNGLRWFFCGGLAMSLFCMGIMHAICSVDGLLRRHFSKPRSYQF